MQEVAVKGVEDIIYSMLRSQHRYSAGSLSINVKRVDGRRLLGTIVSMQEHGDSPGVTIAAEEADIRYVDAQRQLKIFLRNATIDMTGTKLNGNAEFRDYMLPIPVDEATRQRTTGRLPSTLALSEIPGEIDVQQAAIEHFDQDMALAPRTRCSPATSSN